MAYSKKKIREEARQLAEEKKCIFVEELSALMGISKDTYYRFIPTGSKESDAIKDILRRNMAEVKISQRSKWYKSEAPALQLALYKLCATEEELRKLQMNEVTLTATHKILNIDPLNSDAEDHDGPAEISGLKE